VHDYRSLDHALATVKPGDRRVLELRYGLGGGEAHSYREIAQELSITTEGVRHAERRALSTLARFPALKAAA
jgi:RNA polymerase primary sigma factor